MNQSPLTQPETIDAAIKAAFAVGGAESAPHLGLSEAKRHRLVKAAKCPTRLQTAEIQARYPFEVESFGLDSVEKWLKERSSAKPTAAKWLADNLSEAAPLHTVTDRAGNPVLSVGGVVDHLPKSVTVGGARADFAQLMKTGELRPAKHQTESGAFAVISRREWSNEWRIRTQAETAHGLPPEQAGARYTDMLSLTGARKLADSCHFMALKKGGYSTFLTLTFDEAGRSRVEDRRSAGRCTEIEWRKGKPFPLVEWREPGRDMTFTSIQSEASRFFDAAQKMYQRGWVNGRTDTRFEPSKIIGWKGSMVGKNSKAPKPRGAVIREPLHYCWVAENPKNDNGHDNPHLHVLMRWRVPFAEFEGWAARIESLWGQGFAHLEKIKDPEKAGAYMAKAAGYLAKAQGATDQGLIRGNRYGISAASRAPDWVCVGRFEAGIMGSLIADTHDYFTHLYGHHFTERRELNEALTTAPKGSKQRHSIGSKLEKVRAVLGKLPAVVSRYQITFRGTGAASEFLEWARDTSGHVRPDWLPAKEKGDGWSDAAERKPQTAWGKEYARQDAARARYLENQRRRRWDRWTGGDGWWQSLREWWTKYDPIPNNDTTEHYQNWGFC